MFISPLNAFVNKMMLDTVSNSEAAAKDQTLPESKVLDYISNSSKSISGRLISFQAKKKTVNGVSRDYTKNNYFPAHKKVPDGFKISEILDLSKKYLIDSRGAILGNPEINQITVIDRKKDKALQEIFEEYQNKISEWRVEFEAKLNEEHERFNVFCSEYTKYGDYSKEYPLNSKWKKELNRSKRKNFYETQNIFKADWQSFLIEKTTTFVNSYSELTFEDKIKRHEVLRGKETYLGDIIKSKIGVCRHNSFLFKLLMETQGIPVACQSGFLINERAPYKHMFLGHAWNVIKKENNLQIQDMSDPYKYAMDRNYLNTEYNYLYVNKSNSVPIKEKFEQELSNMQPRQKIKIGLDKNGKFVTEKISPDSDFGLELIWGKKDKFILNKIKDVTGLKIDLRDNKTFVNGKIVEIKDHIYIDGKEGYATICPDRIRANFNRRIIQTLSRLQQKCKFQQSSFCYSEILKENSELKSNSLVIFYKDFIKKRIKL